jgi:hypothetical protein
MKDLSLAQGVDLQSTARYIPGNHLSSLHVSVAIGGTVLCPHRQLLRALGTIFDVQRQFVD